MPISKLTLTVAQQSGWYTANFSMADPLYWGKGKGCSFANSPCLSGSPPTPSSSEFCSVPSAQNCDYEYNYVSLCFTATGTVSNSAWNYFSASTISADSYSDNCPIYTGFSNRYCGPGGKTGGVSPEYFGTDSSCFYSWISYTSMNYAAQGACYQYLVNISLFFGFSKLVNY